MVGNTKKFLGLRAPRLLRRDPGQVWKFGPTSLCDGQDDRVDKVALQTV